MSEEPLYAKAYDIRIGTIRAEKRDQPMAGIVIGGSAVVCPSCGADVKRTEFAEINVDGNNPNNSFAYGRVLFKCGHDMETEPGKTVHHTPCPRAREIER